MKYLKTFENYKNQYYLYKNYTIKIDENEEQLTAYIYY